MSVGALSPQQLRSVVEEKWERDEDAEIITDQDDTTKIADPQLRDFENIPLKEDIYAFFAREGWLTTRHEIRWAFENRGAFESVVRMEFSPEQAELVLAEHDGYEVDYAIVIRTRRY